MDADLQDLVRLLMDARIRSENSVAALAAAVEKYVLAADARMARIEERLDGLTKGKGHP